MIPKNPFARGLSDLGINERAEILTKWVSPLFLVYAYFDLTTGKCRKLQILVLIPDSGVAVDLGHFGAA